MAVKTGVLASVLGMVLLGIGGNPAIAASPGANGDLGWDRANRMFEKATPTLAAPEASLHDDGISNFELSYSPDGTQVVFVRIDGGPEIFLGRADGKGTPVALTDDAVVDSAPVFSADGSRVVWERGAGEIWSMNGDGTGAVELTTSKAGDSAAYDPDDPSSMPAVSPQNGTIAFVHDGVLWTMAADGSSKQPLPSTCPVNTGICDPIFANPDYSPNGSEIAFEYLGDIHIVPSSGGTTRPLIGNFTGPQLDPVFSPDGSMVAFESAMPAADYELAVAAADGTDTGPTILTDNFGSDANPAWQPLIEVTRSVTLTYRRKRTFKGTVTAEMQGCAVGRKVKVYRQKRSGDRLVGSDKTDDSGRFAVGERDARGKFYAALPREDVVGTGTCAAAQSEALRVP